MKTNPNDLVSGKCQQEDYGGLTKREHFAGLAMQGLLAGGSLLTDSATIKKLSLQHADALIEELNKNQPEVKATLTVDYWPAIPTPDIGAVKGK